MKLVQLDRRTPNWALFVIQFFPVAPVAVAIVWLPIGYILQVLGVFHQFNVPTSLQDVESDVGGALTLFFSAVIAGLSIGGVWPSLRRTGRWIFLPSLWIVLGFGLNWRQYVLDNSRDSPLIALLDWLCDPSMYIPYAYIGYSIAMTVLLRITPRDNAAMIESQPKSTSV